MTSYRVCFDGKWRGKFGDRDDALTWGREVGETGRMVHVARQTLLRTELVAVFPEDQVQEGERLWKERPSYIPWIQGGS